MGVEESNLCNLLKEFKIFFDYFAHFAARLELRELSISMDLSRLAHIGTVA